MDDGWGMFEHVCPHVYMHGGRYNLCGTVQGMWTMWATCQYGKLIDGKKVWAVCGQ